MVLSRLYHPEEKRFEELTRIGLALQCRPPREGWREVRHAAPPGASRAAGGPSHAGRNVVGEAALVEAEIGICEVACRSISEAWARRGPSVRARRP
jgi:hypothetical protein